MPETPAPTMRQKRSLRMSEDMPCRKLEGENDGEYKSCYADMTWCREWNEIKEIGKSFLYVLKQHVIFRSDFQWSPCGFGIHLLSVHDLSHMHSSSVSCSILPPRKDVSPHFGVRVGVIYHRACQKAMLDSSYGDKKEAGLAVYCCAAEAYRRRFQDCLTFSVGKPIEHGCFCAATYHIYCAAKRTKWN